MNNSDFGIAKRENLCYNKLLSEAACGIASDEHLQRRENRLILGLFWRKYLCKRQKLFP